MSEDIKYRIRESEYDALVAERDHFQNSWAESTRKLHEALAKLENFKELANVQIVAARTDRDEALSRWGGLKKELKEIGVEFDSEGEPFNQSANRLARENGKLKELILEIEPDADIDELLEVE